MIEDVTIRRCTSPGRKHRNALKQRWYEMCFHDVIEWEKRGGYSDEFDAVGLIPTAKELRAIEDEN